MVPFDTESPFVTSGIRVGAPAMTTRGLKEADFRHIADLMNQVISNQDNLDNASKVAKEVHAICERFPLYDFVTA
jgi:glycine hydroxymethyltransferase